ncbi:MAG: SOS response-associated peptidase [Saprospiraceae bacterium]
MCFTLEFLSKPKEKYVERYKKLLPAEKKPDILPAQLPLFYLVSGFSHPELPVVRHDGIHMHRWGLIPFWTKDEGFAMSIQDKTLNAVGETVFEKPSFRNCITKQRCILGVEGFYEWRDYNKTKYPYLVKCKSQEIFSLGCIYDNWVDKLSGETVHTFSILTTPANPLMEKIHNSKLRMPLILDKKDEAKWLDPTLNHEQIQSLIKPFDDSDMYAYTIDKKAGNARLDRNIPEIILPVDYAELDEIR